MIRICPHCGHARQEIETAPEWQCPACQKAYDKDTRSLPPESFRQYGSAASAQERGGVGKWLALFLVLAVAFWFAKPLLQRTSVATAQAGSPQPEVHLYATDWCGYCKATRAFFAANGIRYVEHDIEKSSDALMAHRKLGGNGVPLVVIGDEVIHGYNEASMAEQLRPWLRR